MMKYDEIIMKMRSRMKTCLDPEFELSVEKIVDYR